jgi:hypothetical protein
MSQNIDPDGLLQAKAALQAYLDTQTVFGINVGSHATDAELSAATTSVIQAYLDYINTPKI